MQAGKIKLADIFQDGLIFIVPVYQRNYDWRNVTFSKKRTEKPSM